jgi:hypothetical protein
MRNVEWNSRQGPVCHPVYERTEADELGLEYLDDARLARREGDWVLTDDGKVVKVLRMGTLPTGKRWLRTCTGTFPIDEQSVVIDTADRASRYTMGGTSRKTSHQRHRPEWDLFAEMIANGKNVVEAYKMAFPETSSDRYAKEKAYQLLKKREVRRIVDKKLGDVMAGLGITPEYILKRYKDLADGADADSVSVAALNTLSKIAGLIDSHDRAKAGPTFVGLPQHILDQIKSTSTIPVVAQIESVDEVDFGEAEVGIEEATAMDG